MHGDLGHLPREDHLYFACRRSEECIAGHRCCGIPGEGVRCTAEPCEAPEVVCQSEDDCPATDERGRALDRCQIEVGAYVFDHYGYCRYTPSQDDFEPDEDEDWDVDVDEDEDDW